MNAPPRDAWHAALHTIKRLRANGHVALLAGGCVRDRLLNRTPNDYDIATDATPERVQEVFPRARRVGAKFGVMLVRKFGFDIEVATFRSDGPYSNGRHPDAVTFGSDVEDAERRDFTVNGLFLDPIEDRVIDYVGGREDLRAGIIRTIGDPDRRFAEDHLRMLRAVRFAARFGFRIDPATEDAIKRLAQRLETISVERVWLELQMILTEPTRAVGWSLLIETGLRNHLTPAWPDVFHEDSVILARLAALPQGPIEASLALAAVLCDRSPDETETICRALRLSNRLSKAVVWVTHALPSARCADSLELADLKMLMGQEPWPQLLELLHVDLVANCADPKPYERITNRAGRVAPDQVAPPPLLTGDDLCDMGMQQGPRLGEILDAVYRAQLNEQINEREQAVALARKLMQS